jgi:hypothetical protein
VWKKVGYCPNRLYLFEFTNSLLSLLTQLPLSLAKLRSNPELGVGKPTKQGGSWAIFLTTITRFDMDFELSDRGQKELSFLQNIEVRWKSSSALEPIGEDTAQIAPITKNKPDKIIGFKIELFIILIILSESMAEV